MNKLDEAKINLKNTLERLEKVVSKKLVHKKDSVALDSFNKVKALEAETAQLQTTLKDKKDEINYLREQNSELQAKMGEAQHKTFQLESKSRETADKIDKVIIEVKSYLVEKGLA